MSRTLKIAHRAKKALIAIDQYSTEKWGKDQADLFLEGLIGALELLCEFPEMGQQTPLKGVYRFASKHHIIQYRFDAGSVYIQDIRHAKRKS